MRGRPPDPRMKEKVLLAAVEVYADSGWAGFTIDAVASRGRVGKAAIYRRWSSKEALLVDAIRAAAPEAEPMEIDPATPLRANLITYAEHLIRALSGRLGLVMVRAQLEAKIFPEVLGAAMAPFQQEWQSVARTVVATAAARGEVPLGVSPSLVFDSVRGTIINHYLMTPGRSIDKFVSERVHYAERLVDTVIAGLRAQPVGASDDPARERAGVPAARA